MRVNSLSKVEMDYLVFNAFPCAALHHSLDKWLNSACIQMNLFRVMVVIRQGAHIPLDSLRQSGRVSIHFPGVVKVKLALTKA
jgi:hypothetical protein